MKKFRLKPEAVPFFKEGISTSILNWDEWEKLNIDMNALEEVEPVYVTYGHKGKIKSDVQVNDLSGFNENGSRFLFTIHFPSTKFYEHEKFNDGRNVRELMNSIQHRLNDFYSKFNEDKP